MKYKLSTGSLVSRDSLKRGLLIDSFKTQTVFERGHCVLLKRSINVNTYIFLKKIMLVVVLIFSNLHDLFVNAT